MVYVRREIFANKFRHMLETEVARRVAAKVQAPVEIKEQPWWKRAARMLLQPQLSTIAEVTHSTESTEERGRSATGRLRTEMIRRVDDAPKLINPSGYISEGHTPNLSAEGKASNSDGQPRDYRELNKAELESTARSVTEETDMEVSRELASVRGSVGSVHDSEDDASR